VLGRVVRIDAEQELLVVRVEKRLPAQGGRMRPDGQAFPEPVDVRLVELSELLAIDGQSAADDPGGTQAGVSQAQSGGTADRETNPQPSNGRTESRLCLRVASATYAETPKDATAMTTPRIAVTVLAFT